MMPPFFDMIFPHTCVRRRSHHEEDIDRVLNDAKRKSAYRKELTELWDNLPSWQR